MWEKLKSRKLWLTAAAVLGHVLLGVSGQVSWQEVGNNVTMIVAAYLAVQGYVDGKGAGK
jgi:hypothetical protein